MTELPAPSSDLPVSDNAARHRFELTIDGATAFLVYQRTPDTLTLVHTEVPTELRGRDLGGKLVRAALLTARADGLRPVVMCAFARAYVQKHPELA